MICRLEVGYVINEWDYTQPLLTGLQFNRAKFSCCIQLSLSSIFTSLGSFRYGLSVCNGFLYYIPCDFEFFISAQNTNGLKTNKNKVIDGIKMIKDIRPAGAGDGPTKIKKKSCLTSTGSYF